MNQRLVESVAQIVLAMSDDERRLLGSKLRYAGLKQIDDPTETDKSMRVAEIAHDIQEFEDAYRAPLSALPSDQWSLAAAPVEQPEMPTAEELSAEALNSEPPIKRTVRRSSAAVENQQEQYQSFIPVSPPAAAQNSFYADTESMDYAIREFH